MELFSERFKSSVRKALDSSRLVIVVVHFKARDRLAIEAKSREDAEVFVVTEENRERLPDILVEKALSSLERPFAT